MLDERAVVVVSIHAPREGCDGSIFSAHSVTDSVSIHAPREGCDISLLTFFPLCVMFQFTHPGRGATRLGCSSLVLFVFQFTHPGRGATV